MRELAKLLLELKKVQSNIKDLFDALKPENYDCIVQATKNAAQYDVDRDNFLSPTYAMNIVTSLKQCANIAIMYALKKQGPYLEVNTAEVEANLKTMIQLLNANWKYDISNQAANNLNIKKWNKITIIPLANDLKLLKSYLYNKAKKAASRIKSGNDDVSTYIDLSESIYCRVLLLNRRRPGELQRLQLHEYQATNNSHEKYEEFDRALSSAERVLLKKFKRVDNPRETRSRCSCIV